MSDSNTVMVKIGVVSAARDIELAVTDIDAFISDFESALSSGSRVWWVTEPDGRKRGLMIEQIAYIDIEADKSRTIGFA